MVDAGVQIPLDALAQDVGKPGNPPAREAGERWFKSNHRSTMVVRLPVKQTGVGSTPTGTAPNGRASRPATAAARKAVEAQALAGSTPVPSAHQGRAPGRAGGLQSRSRGFDSFRPCLPPCDAAGVASRLSSGRDGFNSHTGRFLGPGTGRPGDRLICGFR